MYNENEIIAIINQVSNLQLALLGIAITVFTVIYSFIINKREDLKNISILIKAGKGSPMIVQKSSFLTKHIINFKNTNNSLIKIIIVSFFLFTYTWISSNFKIFINEKAFYTVLIIVAIEFIFISIVLIKIISKYKNETKL